MQSIGFLHRWDTQIVFGENWRFSTRNDKSWRKWPASNKSFVKTCYAQTDRLVNSDNSTESPILKEGGNKKIFIFFFNWTWISTQLFYLLDIYIFSRLPTFDYWEYLWYTDYALLTIKSSLSNSTFSSFASSK